MFTITTLMLLTACGSNTTTEQKETSSTSEDNKLSIYTTVYPLTYFTERIGGDYVDVSSIYPAGANEHTFEPTQKDMMALADADLFFYIGLGLEGFVAHTQETLKNEKVKFVATSNAITDEQLAISPGHNHEAEATTDEHAHEEAVATDEHAHKEVVATDEHAHEEASATHEQQATTETTNHAEHNHSNVDPHVWLSPTLSKNLALSIKDELIALLPEQKETFTANYDTLVAELDELDQKFTTMATNAKTKTFFVSHAAFGYIAGTYGLEQVAVAGLNSQDEPSQKELAELVKLAQQLHIKTILFEQNVSSKLTETIQNEIGADSQVLNNLGVLTQENIDAKEDYFTLMNKNIETLSKALNQ